MYEELLNQHFNLENDVTLNIRDCQLILLHDKFLVFRHKTQGWIVGAHSLIKAFHRASPTSGMTYQEVLERMMEANVRFTRRKDGTKEWILQDGTTRIIPNNVYEFNN